MNTAMEMDLHRGTSKKQEDLYPHMVACGSIQDKKIEQGGTTYNVVCNMFQIRELSMNLLCNYYAVNNYGSI